MLRQVVVVGFSLVAAQPARAGCVRISEVVVDVASADAQAEWIELSSGCPETVELGGWRVQRATTPGDAFGDVFVLPDGVTLAPAVEFLVVGGTAATVAAVRLDALAEFGNANNGQEDAIRIVDASGAVQDLLVYGRAAAADSAPDAPLYFRHEDDRAAVTAELADVPSAGMSLARVPADADTNDCAVDFVVGAPTPGTPPPEAGVCQAGAGVVINELFPAPGPGGSEWLELYNPGVDAVDLGGWGIDTASSTGEWDSTPRALPAGLLLPPGGHLVIADAGASFADGLAVYALPSGELGLNNTFGGARLLDCAGAVVDLLWFGAPVPDAALLDEAGAALTADTVGPVPRAERALARVADGVDTDVAARDLRVAAPTPGASNADLVCRFPTGNLRINEVLLEGSGVFDDNPRAFIELYNPTDEVADASGWTIRAWDDEEGWTRVLTDIPAGVRVQPRSWLLIAALTFDGSVFGGAYRDVAPDVLSDAVEDMPSGGSAGALGLFGCDGDRVDTVAFGAVDGPAAPEEDDGDAARLGALRPSEDTCLVRAADGVDTDRSAADFRVSAFCTPRATNTRAEIDDLPDDPVGGCGGRDAGPRVIGEGGCAQAPGAPLALAAVGLALRRRSRATLSG